MRFKKDIILKQSFANVKEDIISIRSKIESLRVGQFSVQNSLNEWIIYLVKENNDLKKKIGQLEKKHEEHTCRCKVMH